MVQWHEYIASRYEKVIYNKSFTGILYFSWNYFERSVEKEGKRKIN